MKIIQRMGKPLAQIEQKCTCSCHRAKEGEMIIHMMACCDSDGNETVEIPLSVTEYFHMTPDEIIEKFSDVLTDKEKELLTKYKMGVDPYDDKKSGDSFGSLGI